METSVCHIRGSFSPYNPPPLSIYSIAECTFPPVARSARTFCDAFVNPMSCSCCFPDMSSTSKSKKNSLDHQPHRIHNTYLQLHLEAFFRWPRICGCSRRCTKATESAAAATSKGSLHLCESRGIEHTKGVGACACTSSRACWWDGREKCCERIWGWLAACGRSRRVGGGR